MLKPETPAAINGTWYKFPCSYFEDSRTYRLRRLLGSAADAIMPRVWAFAASHGGSGDLSAFEPAELADALRYRRDPDKLVAALKESGYLDSEGMLVGWEDLFALVRSRKEIATKIANERWDKVRAAANPDPSEKKEEKDQKEEKEEREEREAHALRDALRDASEHTPAPSLDWPSVLPEAEAKRIAEAKGAPVTKMADAYRAFLGKKLNYGDKPPSQIDLVWLQFETWLVEDKAAHPFMTRFSFDSPQPSTPTASRGLLEPENWKEAVRADCADPTKADLDWSGFDRTQQIQIANITRDWVRKRPTHTRR